MQEIDKLLIDSKFYQVTYNYELQEVGDCTSCDNSLTGHRVSDILLIINTSDNEDVTANINLHQRVKGIINKELCVNDYCKSCEVRQAQA
jgi:hypothetical protein